VVKDSHYAEVKEAPYPVFYTPWRQDKQIGSLGFYVRSALPTRQMIPQIRRVMASLDRDLPPENLRTLDDQIKLNILSDRIVLQLAAAFAILATALAMLGLYGVMAHSVARRTREIGIRMALGAQQSDAMTLILRQALTLTVIGTALGLVCTFYATQVLREMLFGVSLHDPLTFGAVIALMLAVALVASYVPARRATKVDPMVSLRYE